MIECEFDHGAKTNELRHAVAEAIITKDGNVALVKRSMKLSEAGKWAIPGGYMTRDERTKDTAEREALEETGWKIKITQLFEIKDTPERLGEDNQNIAFVYLAEAVKQVQGLDHESDELKWFDLDDLPPKKHLAFDHAETLGKYKKWLKEKSQLPIIG